MSLSRHRSREILFQILFEWDFREQKWNEEQLQKHLQELSEELEGKKVQVPEFLLYITSKVYNEIENLRKIIQTYAPEWPIEKINPIDRNILYIGIVEILFVADTPDAVAIDEGIELGKEFGNENSGKFINGVLNAVLMNKKELLQHYGASTQ